MNNYHFFKKSHYRGAVQALNTSYFLPFPFNESDLYWQCILKLVLSHTFPEKRNRSDPMEHGRNTKCSK